VLPVSRKSLVSGGAGLSAALAGIGVWYQLFRRPLPKTSGRLRVRGLEAPVEVLRDRFGVPHVSARSTVDVCFALGFCHGQDRLWQLEFFRRATAGRLAEFAGAEALGADRLMRTLCMRRTAEREARETPARLRGFLDAYAAGINAAIDSAAALPIEFQLVRLEPEPWSAADLLAASKLMAFGLSTNWELELLRAELVRDAGPERAARLETQWKSLQGRVDDQRYREVSDKLRRQAADASAWRDKCLRYFQGFSGRPVTAPAAEEGRHR